MVANALVVNAIAEAAPDIELNAMPAFVKEKIAAKDKEETCNEDDEECLAAEKKKAEATKNQRTKKEEKMTDQEWLAAAPPTVRSAVQNAMAIEQREKETLVRQLTANVSDEDAQERLAKTLMAKPLDELHDLMALAPAPAPEPARASYMGAAAPATNKREEFDPIDILPLPTAQWA